MKRIKLGGIWSEGFVPFQEWFASIIDADKKLVCTVWDTSKQACQEKATYIINAWNEKRRMK